MIEIILGLIGLAIGSFLNVCIYRLPREESIVKPCSHCPSCKKPLLWYHNLPLISYLILKGRCHYCKWKIPLRYPLVEILSAFFIIFYYKMFNFTISFFGYYIFSCALIIATFTDFEHQIIPDEISLGLLPFGIFFYVMRGNYELNISIMDSFFISLLGGVLGAGSIYFTGVIGKILLKKESMGFGDVKLMALIGVFLGYKYIIFVYFLAPFFGVIYGLYKRIRYKQDYMPYAPFLALAAIIMIIYGKEILSYFLM